jgi:site-specific recombinase XerD
MAHSKGMSIVHVSKIMAHSNIATTLIYSKVLGLDQDEAQDKIFS